MKQLKIGVVLCFVFLSWWSPLSQADTQFRVIVDASGSMQASDPNKITAQALRLIADLAPENKATLGVWLFGEKSRVLFPETLITSASKEALTKYVNGYVTEDVKTDLESILTFLFDTPDASGLTPGYRRDWILVSDGMVDISLDPQVNALSRQRIWSDLTLRLEEKGIHLHTVSLTGYTDKALLDHLSSRTNGTHTQVAVPEDLLGTFDRIYSQAAPSAELPLIEDGFDVDSSSREITFEVLHEVGELPNIVQPNGNSLPLVDQPGVHISDAPYFTLVTVTNPTTGRWHVENIDLKRVHVRVLSDLEATASKIPSLLFSQQNIDSKVALFRNQRSINDPGLLSTIDAKQTLSLVVGGQENTVLTLDMSRDGDQFKSRIEGISQPGLYALTSVVQGATFARQVRQYFTIQPAVSFDVKNSGANLVTFSASPTNGKLTTSLSSMTLKLNYADGTQQQERMPFIAQGHWEKVVPIASERLVKVSAILNGVTKSGEKLVYSTPIWTVAHPKNSRIVIQLGDQNTSLSSLENSKKQTTNQTVKALAVSPDLEVISDGVGEDNNAVVTSTEDTTSHNVMVQVRQEIASITQASWFVYALIGVVAFILILLVFIFSWRSKPGSRYHSEESDDV